MEQPARVKMESKAREASARPDEVQEGRREKGMVGRKEVEVFIVRIAGGRVVRFEAFIGPLFASRLSFI